MPETKPKTDRIRIAEPRRLPDVPRPAESERPAAPGLILFGFCVVYTLILGMGEREVDIGVGDVAEREYMARLDFECVDLAETERQRWKAEHDEPNVYLNDLAVLRPAREAMASLFKHARAAKDGSSVGQLAGLGSNVSEFALDSFHREMQTPEDLEAFREKADGWAKSIFNELERRGVMAAKEYDDERRHGSGYVNILNADDSPPRKIAIHDLVTLGRRWPLEDIVSNGMTGGSWLSRPVVVAFLQSRLRPSLRFSPDRTADAKKAARSAVAPRSKVAHRGDVLLGRNQWAKEQDVLEIETEVEAHAKATRWGVPFWQRLAGHAWIVFMLACVCYGYVRRYQPKLIFSSWQVFALCSIVFLIFAIARALLSVGWPLYLTPVAFVSVVVCIAYGLRTAMLFTGVVSFAVGVLAGDSFEDMFVFASGGFAAAAQSVVLRDRVRLVKAGVYAGLFQFLAVLGIGLLSGGELPLLIWQSPVFVESLVAFAAGAFVGLISSGALPLVETAFNVTTEIRLLEWSDLDQPLMRRLVMEAPGTYHHSLIVGNLAEAAAEAVGASALVARVSAYYHDIGKLYKPEYFVENFGSDANVHDDLTPAMSTLVITAHTKDGVELARQYHLPPVVRDVIFEHHGTTVVEYFYDKATKSAGKDDAHEQDFRYRGPKPQSRESGIVMLTDAVESATRTLPEPNPGRIEALVHQIVQKKLMDGQLDECNLTLREVHRIEVSLIRSLATMYHGRIRYPGTPAHESGRGQSTEPDAREST